MTASMTFREGDRVVFIGEPIHPEDPMPGTAGVVFEELFDDGRTEVRLGVTVDFGAGCLAMCSDDELAPAA